MINYEKGNNGTSHCSSFNSNQRKLDKIAILTVIFTYSSYAFRELTLGIGKDLNMCI